VPSELHRLFRPELIGCFDEKIVFRTLSQAEELGVRPEVSDHRAHTVGIDVRVTGGVAKLLCPKQRLLAATSIQLMPLLDVEMAHPSALDA
jgi:hypothetical protein